MSDVKEIRQAYYEGERSLFGSHHVNIYDTVFGEDESPLKESSDLYLEHVLFQWKYRSGIVKMSKSRTVPGMTWQEQASGIPIISA